jgi:hypothetical protein
MDALTFAKLTDEFVGWLSAANARLEHSAISRIDVEVLRLDREKRAIELREFEKRIEAKAQTDYSNNLADLADRNQMGSSLVPASKMGIERVACAELTRAWREFNHGLEINALAERRVLESTRGWLKRLFRWLSPS